MFKDEKRTQYESLMTTAEQVRDDATSARRSDVSTLTRPIVQPNASQDEAVDDMAREIDDSVQSRARAAPHVSSSGSARESEAYESVPLRGAGRTLAQRAQSHLKALRKTLRNTFSDSLSGSSPGASRTTYSNRAYEDSSFVGSPPSGQLLTRHHARNRSIDLRHVLDTLEETLDGASTAAMLLQELRDSGGDPEADVAVNDALDVELSDVCEAHRSHLMQVAQMSDRFVSLSEDQLGRLLSTVESLNAAVLSIRRTSSAAVREASAPVSIPTGRPSLGSSRIECATTEAEEEAMIAEAISASLKLQADAQNADVASERQPQSPASDGVNATAPSSTRKQTTEELLANLIDI